LALFGRRLSPRGDGLGSPASENLHNSGNTDIATALFRRASLQGVCTENLIRVADVMESPKLAE